MIHFRCLEKGSQCSQQQDHLCKSLSTTANPRPRGSESRASRRSIAGEILTPTLFTPMAEATASTTWIKNLQRFSIDPPYWILRFTMSFYWNLFNHRVISRIRSGSGSNRLEAQDTIQMTPLHGQHAKVDRK
ncbi:hypothetical protein F8388_002153 [Cannabis sativa]|uniref:Uncharacterized protein n=1 Tax=Cannabis sativa TaxID=3483 RepID=A0A7J6H4L0_CANSA|nr:hypothetical protein F8388_002153 [Cannabis sativa]KAF4389891.1 hypothetical protein G4B88_024172 [Cannabis sativa]